MLTALNITNFKAFAETQRIPLRPITLIFGANSAGKSSIIHALALAHHAVETGELDAQRTRIGGESIDLGGFRQYVHQRIAERQVELVFELNGEDLSGRAAELLQSVEKVTVEVAIGAGHIDDQQTLFGDHRRVLDSKTAARVERFAIEADGTPILSMSLRAGGVLRMDRLNHKHPAMEAIFTNLLMAATTMRNVGEDDLSALSEALADLVPNLAAHIDGLFPRMVPMHASRSESQDAEQFIAVSRAQRAKDFSRAVELFLPRILRDLLSGLSSAIETTIRRLQYLGPLRSYPPRHLAFSQDQDSNWFAGGGYTWDVVRTNAEVRDRVNEWLSAEERMQTRYELKVRELVVLDQTTDALYDALERLQDEGLDLEPDLDDDPAEPDGMGTPTGAVPVIKDIDQEAENFREAIAKSEAERVPELVLLDRRTNTIVSHRDVGIGVSQVLPVLVSAYASEGKLIAVEQPEIHLHPALQAELGDVFLESALGENKNTFLIETHSEHLLLRVMRRMRETFDGELPEGLPPVRPEDVMVLFVEPDGSRSVVREMPLNERGELVKAWPGGFFEESLREIF